MGAGGRAYLQTRCGLAGVLAVFSWVVQPPRRAKALINANLGSGSSLRLKRLPRVDKDGKR
jgi:hypothetical protein